MQKGRAVIAKRLMPSVTPFHWLALLQPDRLKLSLQREPVQAGRLHKMAGIVLNGEVTPKRDGRAPNAGD